MTLATAPLRTEVPVKAVQTDTYTVAIVRVRAPWYAPNWLIASKFRSAIGDYEQIPHLERKMYTLGADRHFGGIYLWSDKTAAEAHYSAAWHGRVRERYGVEGEVRLWHASTVVEGKTTFAAKTLSARSMAYPAVATLTLFHDVRGNGVDTLKQLHGIPAGLVRSYFLKREDGQVGVVDMWASDQSKTQFFAGQWLKSAEAQLGAVQRETFNVPVFMNPAS